MVHRKRVRHVHEPGHLHELTSSCYRRLPLLTNDPWRERLARSLDRANREEGVELVGFVYMPEHLHLLVHLTDPGARSAATWPASSNRSRSRSRTS